MIVKNVTESQEKLAYSIADAARLTTLSKSYIRQEIKNGKLEIRRIGRRVLIMPDSLRILVNGSTSEKGDSSDE